MGLKRKIVGTGERLSNFFANDLQNHYYKYFFVSKFKNSIKGKDFDRNADYEAEAKTYWREHTGLSVNTMWHSFYRSINGISDVRYVPENIYYAYIEPYFNRKELSQGFDDKCYYSERFPSNASPVKFKRPETILRNISGMFYDTDFRILSKDEAVSKLLEQEDGYVIKESITGKGGNRIIFAEPGEKKTREEIIQIFEHYNRDYVVESLITQCDEMAALNPSSINCIRFITYMNSDGVHLLSANARMGGVNSRTDNFASGGITCGINENGVLKSVGYDNHYNKYEVHPNGYRFPGTQLPNYQAAVDMIKALHTRFGHFRIISWDIAIASDYTPVVIEFNLTPQGITQHQLNNGPLFGDLTDSVLKEVFKK